MSEENQQNQNVETKLAQNKDDQAKQEIGAMSRYIKQLFPSFDETNFVPQLQNGQLLCEIVNMVSENEIQIIKKDNQHFYIANLQAFIKYCKKINIPSSFLFDPIDLLKSQPPAFCVSKLCMTLFILVSCSQLPKFSETDSLLFSSSVAASQLQEVKSCIQTSTSIVQKTDETVETQKIVEKQQIEEILDLQKPNPDLEWESLKMSIIGSAGAGKTTLVNKIANKQQLTKPTLGADFEMVKFSAQNFNVNLQLVDTAGMEKYKALNRQAIRNSDYCLLVFSLDNSQSFKELEVWKKMIEEVAPGCKYIVVGNKCDLERVVGQQEIMEFVDAQACVRYVEISAISGYGINQIFKIQWEKAVYAKQPIEVQQKGKQCC